MRAWTHENGTLAYPKDEGDESCLREKGWFPVEENSNVTLEQVQTANIVTQAIEAKLDNGVLAAADILKRKPGRPRKA